MKETSNLVNTERNSTKFTRNNSLDSILNHHLPTLFVKHKKDLNSGA